MSSQQSEIVNVWNEKHVRRAEKSWGQTDYPYDLEAYDFLNQAGSWVDLGCGFGRFLRWLKTRVERRIDYVGYDSSEEMLERFRANHPEYENSGYLQDILQPVPLRREAVLCAAVLVHLVPEDQDKVIQNIREMEPDYAAFDINTMGEQAIKRGRTYFEHFIHHNEGTKIRMAWRSHYDVTRLVLKLFDDYDASIHFYNLRENRSKVYYWLKRRT